MATKTGNTKIIEDQNNIPIWPVTHERAVRDSAGVNLETKLGNINSDISQLGQQLYIPQYNQDVLYELGNISISGNGWTYSASNTRVRTPQGYELHLFKGDIIGLSSYTDTRFYIGCRGVDGVYTYKGWMTSDYTAGFDGYYCILVCNTTDTQQISADALGRLIRVTRNTTLESNRVKLDGFIAKDASFTSGSSTGYMRVYTGLSFIAGHKYEFKVISDVANAITLRLYNAGGDAIYTVSGAVPAGTTYYYYVPSTDLANIVLKSYISSGGINRSYGVYIRDC